MRTLGQHKGASSKQVAVCRRDLNRIWGSYFLAPHALPDLVFSSPQCQPGTGLRAHEPGQEKQ